MPRYARKFKEHARIHVGFSGILLEQLRDPKIVDSYRSIVDIPAMLDNYAKTDTIELMGMGYYHPLFPLIPPEDRDDHLSRGRQMMKDVFGRAPRGFWPPEMVFCMEMVPALVKAGYEYVIVDSGHLQPENGVADIYRPYRATVTASPSPSFHAIRNFLISKGMAPTPVPFSRRFGNGYETPRRPISPA